MKSGSRDWKNEGFRFPFDKRRMYLFAATFGLCFIAYIQMFVTHYSPDSYYYIQHKDTYYRAQLGTARLGSYLVEKLYSGVNILRCSKWLTLLLMIVISVIICRLYSLYEESLREKTWLARISLWLFCCLMFINVLTLDLFYFIECVPVWAGALVFMEAAIELTVKKVNVWRGLAAWVLLIISCSFTQQFVEYYIFFSLLHIYLQNDGMLKTKSFLHSLFVCVNSAFAYASTMILLVLLRMMGVKISDRAAGLSVQRVAENAQKTVEQLLQYDKNLIGFFPEYVLTVFIVMLYLALIILLVRRKSRFSSYLYIILIHAACRVVLMAPQWVTAEVVWLSPRSAIGYWEVIALPGILLTIWGRRYMQQIMAAAAVALLTLNLLSTAKFSSKIIATNRIDQEIAYLIQDRINQYQNETGNQVTTIISRTDLSPTYRYSSVGIASFETSMRAYAVAWGGVEAIGYYNQKTYIRQEMSDEDYQKYFQMRQWDFLDLDEQICFDKNRMYMVMY